MMKTIVNLIMFGLLWINMVAQSPQKMSYQAVIRDTGGNLVKSKMIGIRLTILKGPLPSGTSVYSETQYPLTNANGLISVEIGGGAGFDAIDWGNGVYYIKNETDPAGGISYTISSISQLLSVPYALFAKDVQNKDDADADPANELQKISLNGTVLMLDKNGGSVTLPTSGNSGDNWGTDFVHTDATLSGQGTTALPLKIASQSATTGQVMKWDGTSWKPSADLTGSGSPTGPAGGDLTGNYPDPLIGDGKITSAKILDGNVTSSDLATGSVTSAILADRSVSSAHLADNAVTTVKISNLAITSEKINTGAVTGNKIAQSGASDGQVLKWKENTWAPGNDLTGGSGFRLPFYGLIGSDSIGFMVKNTLGIAIEGNSSVGTAIRGFTTSSSGSGVYGDGTNQTGSPCGVWGRSFSTQGTGVKGTAEYLTGNNYGIYGKSFSSSGYGVFGLADASTGTTYGVYGESLSGNGYGISGKGHTGVYGEAASSSGFAVYGKAISGSYSGYFTGGGRFYIGGQTGIGTNPVSDELLSIFGTDKAWLGIRNSETGNTVTDGIRLGNSITGDAFITNMENTNLNLGAGGSPVMTISATGNVGVGTTTPDCQLALRAPDTSSRNMINILDPYDNPLIRLRQNSNGSGGLYIYDDTSTNTIFMYGDGASFINSGNLGIGTNNPVYKLDVIGSIRATGSVYFGGSAGSTNGTMYNKPDFVFGEKYKVYKTEEVEEYLKKENHLPWITSVEKERQENGDATDMTRMAFETVESVENLQFQIIEQHKMISDLKAENELLKKRLEKLEKLIE